MAVISPDFCRLASLVDANQSFFFPIHSSLPVKVIVEIFLEPHFRCLRKTEGRRGWGGISIKENLGWDPLLGLL